MAENFDPEEFIKKYGVLQHQTKWGSIKEKNIDVFVPMLRIKLSITINTPLIFDEVEPFVGGELLKYFGTGIFDKKQFLRLFIDKDDCEEYLFSPHVSDAIYQDLNYGKSYLNYLTYTGECGSNDITRVLKKTEMCILGPVSLEEYLHHICLDIAVRSIEGCVLFKESFSETKWFSELRDSFGLAMDEFPLSMFHKLKSELESVWSKKTMYEFLIDNHTTNLRFKIDFGSRGSTVISPTSFCTGATEDVGEILFSLINYVSEYV